MIKGKALYIPLAGEIDHHSAENLRERIDHAFENSNCKQMIFDFTEVTFMDSSGIGMVIGRYKNAEKRGGTVALVGMKPELTRIYQISGLAKIIASYPSLDEAERQITSGGR